MMNLHSLMEINFSVRAFHCLAYVLLMLPVLLYAQPLPQETARQRRRASAAGYALTAALALYLTAFGALLESHRAVLRDAADFSTTDAYTYLDTLKSYVRRDVFVRSDHQLAYVGNAVLLQDPRYNGPMLSYVSDLRKGGTYTACNGLARYYYLPQGEWQELFACSLEGIAQVRSVPDGWNQ